MRTLFALFAIALGISNCHAEESLHENAQWIQSEKVILRGLDKISARVFTSEIYVNQKVHFGSLEIYVRSANRSPPEEQPESACFIEIFDKKPGQPPQKVFSGWMFSSNPALSALEHPVYDIWVKDVVLPVQDQEETPAEIAPAPIAQATDLKKGSEEPASEEPED